MRQHGEGHGGMAEAAELGADPLVAARLGGMDADQGHMAGDGVDLAAQAGDPEAVDTSTLVTATSTSRPAGMCSAPALASPSAG